MLAVTVLGRSTFFRRVALAVAAADASWGHAQLNGRSRPNLPVRCPLSRT